MPRPSPAMTDEQRAELDELLAPYRADASLERFVCLIDDLEAMRVAAVWPHLPKSWARPRAPMPEDENERWIWIWDGCVFDEWQLAEMVELPLRRLTAKVTLLASARILLPDGTVPSGARGILHAAVGGRIKVDAKKRGADR